MRRLLVTPTKLEIRIFLEKSGLLDEIIPYRVLNFSKTLSVLVTGVGTPSTILQIEKCLQKSAFDEIIQTGFAGSYNPGVKSGELIEVEEDCFADIGIDDNGDFISIFDTNLASRDEPPFTNGFLINPAAHKSGLRKVRSITVNTVSGSPGLISQRKKRFNPDIETMEGAAFFYVCMQNQIPCRQVRSVSNAVEPRNKDAWNIDLAMESLNNWLVDFVNI